MGRQHMKTYCLSYIWQTYRRLITQMLDTYLFSPYILTGPSVYYTWISLPQACISLSSRGVKAITISSSLGKPTHIIIIAKLITLATWLGEKFSTKLEGCPPHRLYPSYLIGNLDDRSHTELPVAWDVQRNGLRAQPHFRYVWELFLSSSNFEGPWPW